ncbi:hypothetical protein [Microcoleus sp. PH2017_20_SFW_D_A]|uniref:hypothetical protein n=1 Tax=Microcoleus sp. PH2017_20_SFW_D_A TaxID=2798831 RepID=UPI001E18860B|nr:hypothetical protein [Microcoleus sp. PH2017_20_SFW_D_A]MCC3523969.1 hypothetical protein [Microcoleus sp. PH2017_20_SFW_D_A]
MPLVNLQPSGALPPELAWDSEVAQAIANHEAKTDPHPTYLTQAEGDGRYRQSGTALTDADIPSAIARDTETTAAITAHEAKTDPHPSLWQRIVAGFLSLAGGQRILKNNPPITYTSFFGGSNHHSCLSQRRVISRIPLPRWLWKRFTSASEC